MTFIKENANLKNITLLVSGNAIAHSINFCALPIIANIYGPVSFGLFAIFLQLVTIFGNIANGRYECAIILPYDDKEAKNIFFLSLIILSIFSITLVAGISLFHNIITVVLKIDGNARWLYYVPVGTIGFGLYQLLYNWEVRRQKFTILSAARPIQSISKNVLKILFGKMTGGLLPGLIWGKILSDMIACMYFISININRNIFRKLNAIKFDELKKCAIKYRQFPKIGVPSKLLNVIVASIPSFLLLWFFSQKVVGNYFLAYSLLVLPISFLGNAIAKTISKEIALLRHSPVKLYTRCKKLYKTIFIYACGPFVLLFFFIDIPISFFFSDKWANSINYIRVLLPSMFVLFLNSPFYQLTDILGKQSFFLRYNFILLVIRSFAIWLGYYYFQSADSALLFFSISSVITGSFFIYKLFCFTQKPAIY